MECTSEEGFQTVAHPGGNNGDVRSVNIKSLQCQWVRGCCLRGADCGIRLLVHWVLSRHCMKKKKSLQEHDKKEILHSL